MGHFSIVRQREGGHVPFDPPAQYVSCPCQQSALIDSKWVEFKERTILCCADMRKRLAHFCQDSHDSCGWSHFKSVCSLRSKIAIQRGTWVFTVYIAVLECAVLSGITYDPKEEKEDFLFGSWRSNIGWVFVKSLDILQLNQIFLVPFGWIYSFLFQCSTSLLSF